MNESKLLLLLMCAYVLAVAVLYIFRKPIQKRLEK